MQEEETLVRTACAAYLASFLARFSPLPASALVDTLGVLAGFAARYAAAHAPLSGAAPVSSRLASCKLWGAGDAAMPHSYAPGTQMGARGNREYTRARPYSAVPASGLADAAAGGAHWQQHEAFYAVVQALLYVLCYHLSSHDATGGAADAQVQRQLRSIAAEQVVPLLRSGLRPLQACLPSVACEFARQCARLGIAQLTQLLPGKPAREARTAAAVPVAAQAQQRQQQQHDQFHSPRPFEMFFPFDPYLLPQSKPLLQLPRCYRSWRGGSASVQPSELHACGAAMLHDAAGNQADVESASDSEALTHGSGSESDDAGDDDDNDSELQDALEQANVHSIDEDEQQAMHSAAVSPTAGGFVDSRPIAAGAAASLAGHNPFSPALQPQAPQRAASASIAVPQARAKAVRKRPMSASQLHASPDGHSSTISQSPEAVAMSLSDPTQGLMEAHVGRGSECSSDAEPEHREGMSPEDTLLGTTPGGNVAMAGTPPALVKRRSEVVL